jgi:GNAT superfamily N-acetyltransferase
MVTVRWAHRGEAPKVYPLFRALVDAEHAEPPRPSAFSRTWGRSFREGSGYRFVVAEGEARRLLGVLSLHAHFSTWKGCGVVSLEDFYVLPEERGKGVGALMMAFAEAHARALGAARIELHVLRGNERALKLYARQGYEVTDYLWLHKKVEPGALGEGSAPGAGALRGGAARGARPRRRSRTPRAPGEQHGRWRRR